MKKALVVYYSRNGENYMPNGIQILEKGHTEIAAEHIRDALGTDIFKIDTVKPYSDNYRQCCMEAVAEMKSGARPAIQGYVDDLSGYDTIFVCFPCWCGTAPMCVFTFLEHYDLTGKRIAPLCTNEGSGLANSEKDLAASCPGAQILPGLSVRGHQSADSRDMIVQWATDCLK